MMAPDDPHLHPLRTWSFPVTAIGTLLAGCVAGDMEIDSARMSDIRRIAVHHVEPPPLVVPGGFQLAMETIGGAGELGALGIIAGGVVVVARADSLSDRARKFENLADVVTSDRIWQPTEITARQVIGHLQDKDQYDVEFLSPMTKLFDGDKTRSWDPYGPIRSWYNGNRPAEGTLSASSDLVIETGIAGYEFAQGVFILSVVLRAVDPRTGEILGRARAIGLPRAPDTESLLANEAREFKELYVRTSDQLTKQALTQLGF